MLSLSSEDMMIFRHVCINTIEGNGNPLQYSCLGNLMDRGARQATIHGAAESDMTEHSTAAACINVHIH